MRVLVSGDRHWPWERRDVIKEALSWFDTKETILIHGGQRGADTHAGLIAINLLGWPEENVHIYEAEWTKFGKPAGNIRNRRMLNEGKPDLVLAFHPDLFGTSKGTYDMVMYACSRGVPVLHYA